MATWNIWGFNRPDKVLCFKRLIQSYKLDLVCILENRINIHSLTDPFFEHSHKLFSYEASCNNFAFSASGRIWVKWDSSKLMFSPSIITSQLISGMIIVSNQPIFQLSVVYASNSMSDRKTMWNSLSQASPDDNVPWAIMGDFNCCRFATEKLGVSPLTHQALKEFNDCIFHNGLMDLHSLDRVIVNESWLINFPDSYYSIQNPSCSDHSPVILHSGNSFKSLHRFLFKNYWTKIDKYWAMLLEVFSKPISGNPISHLCNSLRLLKKEIKKASWSSSSSVSRHIEYLNNSQKNLMEQMLQEHNNVEISIEYKACSYQLANFKNIYASWVIQRAKVNWLKYGEDDIKFLYAKIRSRMGSRKYVINLLNSNPSSNRSNVISYITQYFQELYNPPASYFMGIGDIPIGVAIPNSYHALLASPVTDIEIKDAVFLGSSNSSTGPDGFNFHFYKTSWHIIGPVMIRAVHSFFDKYYMPAGVKATALAIIPKHFNATTIADYRPIALCNVLYKIIAKIIALRLKPVMTTIVKDNQASFLKSRVSTDNILLASDILFHAGKRELRGFKGINVNGYSLSHLLYADDVLIFGDASVENCSLLVTILNEFAELIGLHINYDKSAIMLPKHIHNQSEICNALSIHNITSKISYLGIPLSFYRLKIEDYMPLLDSINRKFNGWKASLLSLAGRLQYLKFTIQNTIAYWIRGAIIPKAVHKLYNCSSPLATWIFRKYGSPWKPLPFVASPFWKSICNTAIIAKHCFKFRIVNSSPISLKWDHWIDDRNVCDLFGHDNIASIPDIAISNIISDSAWVLPDSFSPSLSGVISGIFGIEGEGPCLLWYGKIKSKFKNYLKEFYSDIMNCSWFSMVWHNRNALKYSVFFLDGNRGWPQNG
ncbi:uncharacterized protein LOC110100819 [Dendrobium catenatum]|uniref:uncharacterized protein LOC110100819 n=1 Tax=Dendrobium catenatum TaxID=906689 RepID=UPI0009F493C4|nr:uncharacterized protein LOC110100819 [Dendrobium catenatum]